MKRRKMKKKKDEKIKGQEGRENFSEMAPVAMLCTYVSFNTKFLYFTALRINKETLIISVVFSLSIHSVFIAFTINIQQMQRCLCNRELRDSRTVENAKRE